MAAKNLGSPVPPFMHEPDNTRARNLKPIQLTTTNPLISDEAMTCVQSFADATGLPLDCIVTEALLYWWDTNAGDVVSQLERRYVN
ncbi:MAG TPA: hypothetical protein VMV98_10095 [Acidobacteriaceae bacterium]|nr:hypothetical protein [Acidobacteriaceae bacterium]